MAVSLKHNFVSTVPNDANSKTVGSLEWNEEHNFTMSSGKILGRSSSGTGAVEELDPSSVSSLLNINAINVKDYGAVGDGVTDDRAALALALAEGADLYFPAGTYRVESSISLTERCIFEDGAIIDARSGATVTLSKTISASPLSQIFSWDGTGAFSITGQGSVSVRWFGAVADGATDAQAAVQKAVDSISTGEVFFPKGSYVINTSVTITKDRIKIRGESTHSTIVTKGGTGSNLFVSSSTNITSTRMNWAEYSDLTLNTASGSVHTAGSFIRLYGVNNARIERVFMSNAYIGLNVVSSSNIEINNVDIYNNGAAFSGVYGIVFGDDATAAARNNANVFCQNVRVRGPISPAATSLETGIAIWNSDGIWFDNLYIGGIEDNAMIIDPVLSDSQTTGIVVNNGWFDPNGNTGNCVWINAETTDNMGQIRFSDCMFSGGGRTARGIWVTPTGTQTIDNLVVDGCIFQSLTRQAILIAESGSGSLVRHMTITGNVMRNCATASTNSFPVIEIDGAEYFSVTGNQAGWIGGLNATVTTGTANYGLTISSNCDHFSIVGNNFTGNQTGEYLDNSGGGATKIIAGNKAGEVYATLDGTETLTNKTITSAAFSGTHTGAFTTSGNITIDGAGNAELVIDKGASGNLAIISSRTGGSQRWQLILGNATAESSTSTGSDFLLRRSSNTGAYIDDPISISRATGIITLNATVHPYTRLSTGYTVATLPTATLGTIARVTDANAPAVGSTVAGGGAAAALVWYNGSNWTVIGV